MRNMIFLALVGAAVSCGMPLPPASSVAPVTATCDVVISDVTDCQVTDSGGTELVACDCNQRGAVMCSIGGDGLHPVVGCLTTITFEPAQGDPITIPAHCVETCPVM